MRGLIGWVMVAIAALPAALAEETPATKPAAVKETEIRPLAIGSDAPDFELPGTDGRKYRLRDFADAKILVVIFTCNHCPTAQAYEGRINKLAVDFKPKGVAVVAISPNDPQALRLDELGYTDLGDSLDDMKTRAEDAEFKFPYLYDGENQKVSKAYGPSATPTVFIFDGDRKLRYVGRFDDSDREKEVKRRDVHDALDALLAGQPVSVEKTKSFGCSTKWSDKRDSVTAAMKKLAEEPVSLESVDAAGIKTLMQNKTDKFRLVNVWASWCGPCLAEFPELVTIHRMYRGRKFEVVTLSADYPDKKDVVLSVLKLRQASNRNLIFSSTNKYEMLESIDKNWDGAVPFTILIRPGGEVAYKRVGTFDPLALRRLIVKELGPH